MNDLRLHGVVGKKKGSGIEALEISIPKGKATADIGSFVNGEMRGVEYLRLPWTKNENNNQSIEYTGKSMVDYPVKDKISNGAMLFYRRVDTNKFLSVYQYMAYGIIYLEFKVHLVGMHHSHIVSRKNIKISTNRTIMNGSAQSNADYNYSSNGYGFVERVGELNVENAYYLVGTKDNSSVGNYLSQPMKYVGVTVNKSTDSITLSNILNAQYNISSSSYYRMMYETIPDANMVIDFTKTNANKGYIKAIKFDVNENRVIASTWKNVDVRGGSYQSISGTMLGGYINGKICVAVAKSGYSNNYSSPICHLFEIVDNSDSLNIESRGSSEGLSHSNVTYCAFQNSSLSSSITLYYANGNDYDVYSQNLILSLTTGVKKNGNCNSLGYNASSSQGIRIFTRRQFQLPYRKAFVRIDGASNKEYYYCESMLRVKEKNSDFAGVSKETFMQASNIFPSFRFFNDNLNLGYTGDITSETDSNELLQYKNKYLRLITGSYERNGYYYPMLRYFTTSHFAANMLPYNYANALPAYNMASKEYCPKVEGDWLKVKLGDSNVTYRTIKDGDIIDLSKLNYDLIVGAIYYIDQCGNIICNIESVNSHKWYKKIGIAINSKEILVGRG